MPAPITSPRSRDYSSDDSDEKGVCGARSQSEARTTKSADSCDAGGEFHAPCLPDSYGGVSANEVVKNMTTTPQQTDDSKGPQKNSKTTPPPQPAKPADDQAPKLDEMTWKALHTEMHSLQAKLLSSGDYSRKTDDVARLQALEGEELRRRTFSTVKPPTTEETAAPWQDGGPFATLSLDHGIDAHVGVLQMVVPDRVADTKVTNTLEGGSGRLAVGTHNADGSTGLHVVATLTGLGVESDADNGHDSSAVGIGVGVGVDLSIGLRDEALCYRIGGLGLKAITIGACMSDQTMPRSEEQKK